MKENVEISLWRYFQKILLNVYTSNVPYFDGNITQNPFTLDLESHEHKLELSCAEYGIVWRDSRESSKETVKYQSISIKIKEASAFLRILPASTVHCYLK